MSYKPRVFVASSREGLRVAQAIHQQLQYDAEVTLWNQGIFRLTRAALESLLETLQASGFGIFVLTPDDTAQIRGQHNMIARDNVLLELGMFFGKLGRDRTFMVLPRGLEDLHLPTDLLGLQPALYEAERTDGNLQAAVGPATTDIINAIRLLQGAHGPSSLQYLTKDEREPLLNAPPGIISAIQDFESVDPEVRRRAVIALSASSSPHSTEGLAIGAVHHFQNVRHLSARFLGSRGDKRAIPGLVEALGIDDYDPEFPRTSWVLRSLGSEIIEPTLRRLSNESDRSMELEAVDALGSYLDTQVTQYLIQRLEQRDRGKDQIVREHICSQLQQTPRKQAKDGLLHAATDKDSSLSRAACKALIALGNFAKPQLKDLLGNGAELTRCFVFQALGPKAPRRLVDELIRLGLQDPAASVQMNAKAARERIERGPIEDED